jgi:hypothetical protein
MRPWSVLVRAARAWRASTTPQPPLAGVSRPFLIDPPLWASMEPADVRWALRAAVAEYRATWAGTRVALKKLPRELTTPARIAQVKREAKFGTLADLLQKRNIVPPQK